MKNNVLQFKKREILEANENLKRVIISYKDDVYVGQVKVPHTLLPSAYAFEMLNLLQVKHISDLLKNFNLVSESLNINVSFSYIISEDFKEIKFCDNEITEDETYYIWESTNDYSN